MSDPAQLAGQHLVSLAPVGAASISPERDQALEQVAVALSEADPALATPSPAVQTLQATKMPTSTPQRLLLDDFSAVSHIDGVLGLEFYTSRAFVRAGEGDVVLGTFDPIEGYTDYMNERLGLGLATYLPIPKVPSARPFAICQAAVAQPDALDKIAETFGSQDAPLWFHPYMGHSHAWALAEALQARTPRKLEVVAPTPVLCDRVNNKVWFLDSVRAALGDAYAVPSRSATSAEEAAASLREIAKLAPRISLKLADSASGMGTSIFVSAEIQATDDATLIKQMEAWLVEKDWVAGVSPPVSIEPWHDDVLGSPSVQLWIPPLEAGAPWVEGIYDQLFYPNDPFVFLGSIPSQLPAAQQAELRETGAALGRVYQRLGFLGRCSFDTILVGPSLAQSQLIYVECNGRWGGTSTPMTLLNRVFGDFRARPYAAKDFDDHRLKGMSFAAFVGTFDDILYNARTGKGWAIVYNVGCLTPAGKLDVIALGDTFAQANERQEEFQAIVNARMASV